MLSKFFKKEAKVMELNNNLTYPTTLKNAIYVELNIYQ